MLNHEDRNGAVVNAKSGGVIEPLGIDAYDIEGGRVVVPSGEVDLSRCDQLGEHSVAAPGDLVVVDLAQVTFLDSSGLGALHGARRRAIKDGGNLVLTRPRAMVARVLEITGLEIWVVEWEERWARR